jgi:mannose-6-phosphate isomerase-like protein (cupin superfamily)
MKVSEESTLETIEAPWGWHKILEKNPLYMVKMLFMNEGHRCSLQYHEEKIETIIVARGTLQVEIDDEIYVLHENDDITINNRALHRMTGLTDCYYIECSTPFDDTVRVEDDYGRV